MWLLPFSNHSAAAPITTSLDPSESSAQQDLVPLGLNDTHNQLQLTTVPTSGPTLLPSKIASLVSLFSKSTTLSIRLSSLIGQIIIDSARTTTLSSLELARAGVEGVLLRAFQDVEARRISQEGGMPIDHGWTESMLEKLHATITLSQLLISTGFEASATGLNAVKELSQGWIYIIDSVFGETESSRAIKAILTLIIQEFGTDNKTVDGVPSVGVLDLLAGLACFAILQKKGRRRRAKEISTELIWDVVVGDSSISILGGRGPELEEKNVMKKRPSLVKLRSGPASSVMTQDGLARGPGEEGSWTVVRGDDDDDDMSLCSSDSEYVNGRDAGPVKDPGKLSKTELAAWLARLPPAAEASITSTTTTTQRTTIEVTGINGDSRNLPVDLDFIPPSNAVILAEESHHAYGETEGGIKKYKLVYETVQKKVKGRKVTRDSEGRSVVVEEVIDGANMTDGDGDLIMMDDITRGRMAEEEVSDTPLRHSEDRKKSRRSKKHALEDGRKKADREKKREKKHRDREKGKNRDEGQETDKKGRDKKDKKHRDKDKKDKSLRKAFAAAVQSQNHSQPPPHTPPIGSPNSSRWRSPQSDYFSMSPDQKSYMTTMKRSSSVTRTSASSVGPSSNSRTNSRTDSYITSREDSIQSPNGNQLRRTYSREILPINTAIISEASVIPSQQSPTQSRQSHHPNYQPSIHTLRTTHSSASLSVEYITQNGLVILTRDDMLGRSYFPRDHLCRNMSKFMRFSSASYGSNFMRFLGIGAATAGSSSTEITPAAKARQHHHEHHAFSFHTSLPVDTILLSSFTDPGGGYDFHGEVNTGVPLVHFICVDHKAKAIVLTCRGTLGLDDVVTDLTCEYGDLEIRGKTYKVHKGMLNSALLLLRTRNAKVLMTLRDALERHEGYGLVFCGHSLGGGVAAILSILLSTPTPRGGYVTSNMPFQNVNLPEGRPIHCYAYGSPACVCTDLGKATRGLITSVVYGRDVVPCLSFGMIRDFHSVALAFKEDTRGLRKEIGKIVLGNLTRKATGFGVADDAGSKSPSPSPGLSNGDNQNSEANQKSWSSPPDVLFDDLNDDYLYATLKTLRAGMDSLKLVPPGEVYVVETQTVFQQDRNGGVDIKPATRVTARAVKDVDKRFSEIGFGRGMFSDHSPANYEGALEMLLRGVCGEDEEDV